MVPMAHGEIQCLDEELIESAPTKLMRSGTSMNSGNLGFPNPSPNLLVNMSSPVYESRITWRRISLLDTRDEV